MGNILTHLSFIYETKSAPAYPELTNVGFTASQSSGVLNSIHGDYICEHHNAEAKASRGLLKKGFVRNSKTFNTWIRTNHIAADMQQVLNQVLNI